MENLEKYQKAFKEALELKDEEIANLTDLEYLGIASWDSVGHMGLVAAIEDEFDIMMDTDDIIDFSSYQKGIELLKKYDVLIEE